MKATRAKRRIIIACMAVGVLALALQITLAATGRHYTHQTIAGYVFPLMSVLGGVVYLRSTRGQR